MPDAAALDLLSQHGAQKRARAQLSCTACRVGKLKCNRQHPACDQCIKRNKEATCAYVAPPQRKKPNQSMKDRIRHLESLVVELYSSNNAEGSDESPSATTESPNGVKSSATSSENGGSQALRNHPGWYIESDENTRAFGRMNISKKGTKYVASSHWEAILDNIAEVRSALDDDVDSSDGDDANTPESDTSGSELRIQSLLHPDPTIRMTRQDLINALPQKSRADSLVAMFFNSTSPSVSSIHGPTFQKEYAAFWQNPDGVTTMWLGLLYAIMSMGCRYLDRKVGAGDAPRPVRGSSSVETRRLQSLCASALILAPYTKPAAYTIEALMVYMEGDFAECDENHLEVWLLLGVNLRLALRMGLHRDAEHSRISAFEGEMRRRMWTMLYMFDILMSFELGLPPMMLQLQFDTKLPHNLNDRDFGPEMAELPEPKPDEEFTNVSYIRTKFRICKVFGKAAEMNHSTQLVPCSEVLVQDQRLTEVHETVPPALRIRPLEECLADPPGLMMLRFNIELLVQKTRCLLHRRFLTETIHNGDMMEASRKTCISSARRILDLFTLVDSAFEAGLMPHGWYLSSLNSHDFLLASMVIALDLDRRVRYHPDTPPSAEELSEAEALRKQLESTYLIWQKPIHRSNETDKACKAVLIMLAKIERSKAEKGGSTGSSVPATWSTPTDLSSGAGPSPAVSGLSFGQQQPDAFPSALPTPGPELLAGSGLTPLPMEYSGMDFAPMADLLDMPAGMDWQTWDTYVYNQTGNTSGTVHNGVDMMAAMTT